MFQIYLISNDQDSTLHWQALSKTLNIQLKTTQTIEDASFFLTADIVFIQNNIDLSKMDLLINQLTNNHIKVVVLDATPNVSSAIHIFKLGARGYLNTFASAHRVQQVIKTLQDGQVWVGQDILSQMIQADPSNHDNNAWQEGLTHRQIQIIECLLEGQSNQIIADNLYLSIATIKKEMSILFERFSAQDRLDLVLKIKNY